MQIFKNHQLKSKLIYDITIDNIALNINSTATTSIIESLLSPEYFVWFSIGSINAIIPIKNKQIANPKCWKKYGISVFENTNPNIVPPIPNVDRNNINIIILKIDLVFLSNIQTTSLP